MKTSRTSPPDIGKTNYTAFTCSLKPYRFHTAESSVGKGDTKQMKKQRYGLVITYSTNNKLLKPRECHASMIHYPSNTPNSNSASCLELGKALSSLVLGDTENVESDSFGERSALAC